MLKMTVSPLASRNNSMPNRMPFSVDMMIKLEHEGPPLCRSSPCDDGRGLAALYGRSILQVVGSTVLSVSILATSFQPQPVFSSSNGSFSVRSPNDEMYIG